MPGSLPKPELCIFDLDGTLVDSLRDIAEAFNHCLILLGLPTHPVDHYRYMAGDGVLKLCERAAGETHPHLVNRLAELVRPCSRARAVLHTRPFAGIPEVLERLDVNGVHLAVLSNKPHVSTLRVVQTFWHDNTFQHVQGCVEDELRKPSPAYFLRICERLGVEPGRAWMVGDTPTDIATARAAGAVAVGVTWGFRPRADLEAAGADLVVDQPAGLMP